MIMNFQQLIAVLPLLTVVFTVITVILSIAWRRNHFINATLTVIGFNLTLVSSLVSFCFVVQIGTIDVTPLLHVDFYAVFYTALVILASLATCTFSYPWLSNFPDNKDEFYPLVLIAALGGMVLTSANHLASLFVGIELLSIPLFGMIGYVFRQKRSLEATLKYTILSAVASSFLLFGIALVYAETGSLSFVKLGQTLNDSMIQQQMLLIGLGMIIIGLSFKLSLVPFHLWTPDVYQGSPAPVSTFLATASKIAIFGAVMRLFMSVPFLTNSEVIRTLLSAIAFVSILFGNLMAISQSNIKRLLGYSSIAHLGYLLVALIALKSSNQLSLETSGIYLTGYLFSSLGAFGVVSLMSGPYRGPDADSLYSYRGLFWHRPILSAVMTVMMLSLAGIPMTLGFIGKFYIIALSISEHLWWLTAAIVVGSAIGLYYYMRVTVSLYLSPPELYKRDTLANWAFTAGGLVVLISAFLVLFLGVYPQPLIMLVQMTQRLM